MAATSAQNRAFGLRVALSVGVVALLTLIILVVMAPWSSASTISSAAFSDAAPAARGAAALESAHLAPGQSVTGSLLVRNDGDAAGRFVLGARADGDPGASGGSLSEQLQVVLLAVTDGSADRELYRGSLAGLRGVDLGDIDGGATRTYRISVHYPGETGSDAEDDTDACGPVSVAFDWTAVAQG